MLCYAAFVVMSSWSSWCHGAVLRCESIKFMMRHLWVLMMRCVHWYCQCLSSWSSCRVHLDIWFCVACVVMSSRSSWCVTFNMLSCFACVYWLRKVHEVTPFARRSARCALCRRWPGRDASSSLHFERSCCPLSASPTSWFAAGTADLTMGDRFRTWRPHVSPSKELLQSLEV